MFVYHTKRRDQYYDKVISIYQETGYGRKRIAKMLPVGEKTIARWIANFVAENGTVTPQTVMQTNQEPNNEELQALKKKVAELEKQLKYQEMRADAYDTMIDIAEKKFNIPIRKKAGARQRGVRPSVHHRHPLVGSWNRRREALVYVP